jgi:hypothetical protein
MSGKAMNVLLVAISTCAACGGRSLAGGVVHDAGPGVDSSVGHEVEPAPAPPEMTAVDGGTPDGANNTLSVVPSPPASDDQRLDSFVSQDQGGLPNGWDTCQSPGRLSRAPKACDACPAPSRGTSYLRYTGSKPAPDCGAGPDQTCPPLTDSQIFSYFTPPLAASEPQSLWFDLIHLAGDPSDATLTIYATNQFCGTLEPLGTWRLADILAGVPQWKTSCVTLKPSQETPGLGFTFSGSQVDLGFDALRFGPACPAH